MKQKSAIFLLVLLFVMIVGATVNAYTGEIDPENYITLPFSLLIVNNKSTATISVNTSGYDIYYQKVDMTESVYNSLKNKHDEAEKYSKDAKKEIEDKKAEVKELEDAYKELIDSASEANSTVTDAEIEEARTKYETAYDEYSEAVDAANTRIDELNQEFVELVPNYTSSWTKTTNTSSNMTLDFTGYSGKVYFVLWAKIDNGTNTYYDFDIYSNNIEPSEPENQVNEIKENVINTVKENNIPNTVVDNTLADGKLPQTGNNILIGISVIAFLGLAGFVSYYKAKKYDL